jgi:hypothetical protein
MAKLSRCQLHQALARAFVDHGVGTTFESISDANSLLVDSFIRIVVAVERSVVQAGHGAIGARRLMVDRARLRSRSQVLSEQGISCSRSGKGPMAQGARKPARTSPTVALRGIYSV